MLYYNFLIILLIAISINAIDLIDTLKFVKNTTYGMEQLVGQSLDFEYYTGYIPVGNALQTKTSLYFSLATKTEQTLKDTPENTPVIFYFGGGPGMSSQFSNWVEVGPFYYDQQTEKAKLRQYSWNKLALLVFVDQPLNVGFSYSQYENLSIKDMKKATNYFKKFLQNFYKNKKLSHLNENPTFFYGSGYAASFVSSFGAMVLKDQPVENFNFQGIGLGNPWIDPIIQTSSLPYNYFNAGVSSSQQQEEVQQVQTQISENIQNQQFEEATQNIIKITDQISQNFGQLDMNNFNFYNLEGQQDLNTSTAYWKLMQNSVFMKVLYIPKYIPRYDVFNQTVFNNFQKDISQSQKQNLEYIINNNSRVLIFGGQLDLQFNIAGVQNLLNQLDSSIIKKWKEQKKTVWFKEGSNKEVIGNYQNQGFFTYANIYNAGQMVSADQPESSFQMIYTFLQWDW